RTRRASAHPQCVRTRATASVDQCHRELSAGRWVDRHPERDPLLHARAREHRTWRVSTLSAQVRSILTALVLCVIAACSETDRITASPTARATPTVAASTTTPA